MSGREAAFELVFLFNNFSLNPGLPTISENKIKSQLSYLIEHGFVIESHDKPTIFSVDEKKLAQVMEHDENYQSAVDGLTKLDGFLN